MKAGTTSLYNYLGEHPQIYMSPLKKSPDFFAIEGRKLDFNGPEGQAVVNQRIKQYMTTTIEEYRALFRGVSNEIAIGEASPIYLYSPEAVSRIRHYIPEAKLIAVLRNPADRAYSGFLHTRFRDRREPLSTLAQALEAEEERIQNNWEPAFHYKNMGLYYRQLKRYYEAFDRTQIRIYLYEDLENDAVGVVQDICSYLGVDDTFTPVTSVRYNVSGIHRSKVLLKYLREENPLRSALRMTLPKAFRRRIAERVYRYNLIQPPLFPQEVRRELIEVYREDIFKLQHLIQRDLSGWLE